MPDRDRARLRRPDRAPVLKPVIAACNGSAAGGAWRSPCLRHGGGLRARAKFGCTEVGLGIAHQQPRLARDVNTKTGMELLTGKKIQDR